jgi:hypothetical protein
MNAFGPLDVGLSRLCPILYVKPLSFVEYDEKKIQLYKFRITKGKT